MYLDTMNIGNDVGVLLGEASLAVAHTYKYIGHILTNHLSDESDMEEKLRCRYVCQELYLENFTFVLKRSRIHYSHTIVAMFIYVLYGLNLESLRWSNWSLHKTMLL